MRRNSKRRKHNSIRKCSFSRCNRRAELTIVFKGQNFPICRYHFMYILNLLERVCEKEGEASLEDLTVYVRKNVITMIKIRGN